MRRNSAGNTVRLRYVKTVIKPSGAAFHYLRVPGMKPVRLPDGDKASPAFLTAYAAAMKALQPVRGGPKLAPGSIAAAVSAYQTSRAFAALAETTRANQRRILSKIVETWGAARLMDLRSHHIEADIATLAPNSANSRLKCWRSLCAWAKATRAIASDPSRDVEKPQAKKSDGHRPWTPADIEAFRDHWPTSTPQRLAMELVYWTAARASDAVRLGPGMVDKDGWLVFKQQKTGGTVSVPFARDLPDFATPQMVADLAHLREAIELAPRHMTWLVTAHGSSRSVKAFSSWLAGAAIAAGLTGGKSAHGLRKARAQALAEAGATTHQIAAWTGHETLSEVQRYASAADRRRILSGTPRERILETGLETAKKV